MTKQQYQWFVEGKTTIGDPGGQFITTRDYMDGVFASAKGDIHAIEEALGFPKGHFSSGGGLVRIDVDNPLLHNARLPSGFERGANDSFRWGGYTSGGAPEIVIDSIDAAGATIKRVDPK